MASYHSTDQLIYSNLRDILYTPNSPFLTGAMTIKIKNEKQKKTYLTKMYLVIPRRKVERCVCVCCLKIHSL